jgi:tRNA A-37 threonylcarbamoyl transferase component Bud32
MGLALEKVFGRRADANDFEIARDALKALHNIGLRHGDVNRDNFIITGNSAVLIDFATTVDDMHADDEIETLKEKLGSDGRAGYYPAAWENNAAWDI